MKIHAVFWTKINQLWSREISCYCSYCLGPSFKPLSLCDGWKEHSLWKDVAALPKILPHSQLESDGKGSKEADLPMLIEIKKWRVLQLVIQKILRFTSEVSSSSTTKTLSSLLCSMETGTTESQKCLEVAN